MGTLTLLLHAHLPIVAEGPDADPTARLAIRLLLVLLNKVDLTLRSGRHHTIVHVLTVPLGELDPFPRTGVRQQIECFDGY